MQLDQNKENLIETIQEVINAMNISATICIYENKIGDQTLNVASIKSDDNLSILIGKNGQNLKALEHVVKVVLGNKIRDFNFILDINDYRRSRVDYVVNRAQSVAVRVRETKRAEAMFPMTSYERRLVHMELASCTDVETESIGDEPRRRVVIRPVNDFI